MNTQNLNPGCYIARKTLPLLPPFRGTCIRPGQRFDVLDASEDLLLVRHDGQRVWKARETLPAEAVMYIGPLPHATANAELPHIEAEERVPLDDYAQFARAMGVGDV